MTLAHDVTGSGPAVLLLHSTVGDRRMWDPQIPALTAAGYRVVRCDLRGYGDSPMPDGPHDDAHDVAGLLDDLRIEHAAVVGASGGGRAALEFAARWPGRVDALLLLCTALRGHEPSAELRKFGEQEDALLEAGDVAGATDLNVDLWLGPEADDATRAKVRMMQRHAFEVQLAAEEGGQSPSEEAGEAAGDEARRSAGEAEVAGGTGKADDGAKDEAEDEAKPNSGPDLSSITAPALIVSGAHDLPDFQEIAVHLAGELPHARHLHLDWAGHLPNLESPDRTNPLLVTFLTETVPPA
ncbi:alpha/beta fold hydrolase [Actinoplanes aureus]|uniref:Alpha/beta fold hydrolase n=1 Tax=Actinoplanes aureus TaxID=2792083 RepID=A0A931G024_9ACTN|nr:alpha/beta hydrolase [Actinoplanes aureus]MBG0563596.1 alpha/beta fold hydrolase [Actinoplanes aureus]